MLRPQNVVLADKCANCQKEPAAEPHPCPFNEEVKNDSETLCTCCAGCTHDCLMET